MIDCRTTILKSTAFPKSQNLKQSADVVIRTVVCRFLRGVDYFTSLQDVLSDATESAASNFSEKRYMLASENIIGQNSGALSLGVQAVWDPAGAGVQLRGCGRWGCT